MEITLLQGIIITLVVMVLVIDRHLEALFIFRPIIVCPIVGAILGDLNTGLVAVNIMISKIRIATTPYFLNRSNAFIVVSSCFDLKFDKQKSSANRYTIMCIYLRCRIVSLLVCGFCSRTFRLPSLRVSAIAAGNG